MDTGTATRRNEHQMVLARLLPIILLALIALGAVGIWAAPASGLEIVLPVLALGGIVALLIAIALVSIVFKSFDMADAGKALALPEGSVRAILALSLLVLFAIFSVFLYVNIGTESQIANDLDATQEAAFLKGISAEQQAQIVVRVTGSKNGAPAYSISLRDANSQARQDLAKQLIGILATLLSALAGFYFGANTATTAVQSKTPDQPNAPNPPNPLIAAAGAGNPGGAANRGGAADRTALQALSAVTLPAGARVAATREASALGHDPLLASEPDPQKQNRGVVS